MSADTTPDTEGLIRNLTVQGDRIGLTIGILAAANKETKSIGLRNGEAALRLVVNGLARAGFNEAQIANAVQEIGQASYDELKGALTHTLLHDAITLDDFLSHPHST